MHALFPPEAFEQVAGVIRAKRWGGGGEDVLRISARAPAKRGLLGVRIASPWLARVSGRGLRKEGRKVAECPCYADRAPTREGPPAMPCPRCQHENRPQAKLCEDCAAPLARTCPNYGAALVAALVLALLAAPLAAEAQQPRKVYRIGFLASAAATSDASPIAVLRQALRDLGYAEGRNLVIEYRAKPGNLPIEQPTKFELVI